jgi:hypothetical protein
MRVEKVVHFLLYYNSLVYTVVPSTVFQPYVSDERKLTHWGCGEKLGLIYAAIPRLIRYSTGLSEPSEILIRFSLYQRIEQSMV